MRLTARVIIKKWLSDGVNLTGIERVLELPFGTFKPLYEAEGPAPPETEILLNMINHYPFLLTVAEENFDLKKIVVKLFDEWKNTQ